MQLFVKSAIKIKGKPLKFPQCTLWGLGSALPRPYVPPEVWDVINAQLTLIPHASVEAGGTSNPTPKYDCHLLEMQYIRPDTYQNSFHTSSALHTNTFVNLQNHILLCITCRLGLSRSQPNWWKGHKTLVGGPSPPKWHIRLIWSHIVRSSPALHGDALQADPEFEPPNTPHWSTRIPSWLRAVASMKKVKVLKRQFVGPCCSSRHVPIL